MFFLVASVHDLIHLKHFGKKEILRKIDLMEGQYNIPMRFDLTASHQAHYQLQQKWRLEPGAMG